ncbi:MAG: hypothetical protein P1U88_20640 [Thalassobaculaceae bacterium]|nr:hypothetical protein [Thalassobaculaceae bacterium]
MALLVLPAGVLLYFFAFDCLNAGSGICTVSYWRGDFWGAPNTGAPGSVLEAWYFLASSLGGLAGLTAAALAYWRLGGANRASKAEILLRVDEQWSSVQYRQARIALRQALSDAGEDFVAHMRTLAREDYEAYLVTLEIADLLETIGLLVRRGYLALEDVDSLLGQPVIGAYAVYRPHIDDLRRGAPTTYANFEWLADEIRNLRAER